MFCKNRITLIGFLGKDALTRSTTNGTTYSRFSIATNVSWKDRESGEYRTRTQWHACIVWTKLGEWAASLKKGAFVEVEGELRYRGVPAAWFDNQSPCCRDSRNLDPHTEPRRKIRR